jgi:hypothetical protein
MSARCEHLAAKGQQRRLDRLGQNLVSERRATRPAEAWLGPLSEGGRLILPLTTNKGFVDNDPPVPIERR